MVMQEQYRYDNQVVVVTGAGAGLGKSYALFFGCRGASVVVNDLGGAPNGEGQSSKAAADIVVHEIESAGGRAVSSYDSVESGHKIIQTAIQTFGRIDILINNAGILRDISFKNMTDQDWNLIMKVHVTGAVQCTSAAWPYFTKQKYGRIINTTSAAGLYGNFGQTNYSAAKLALVAYTQSLAKDGARHNIMCNVVAPIAASRMMASVTPDNVLAALKPEYVVPVVAILTHKSNETETGGIFEVGGGFVAKDRWQRSKGLLLPADNGTYTPSAILERWSEVVNFEQHSQFPTDPPNYAQLFKTPSEMVPVKEGVRFSLEGKVVLITGACSKLGQAYCFAFAKYGAAVVAVDCEDPAFIVTKIRELFGSGIAIVGSPEKSDNIVQTAMQSFGRVDIVVNNWGSHDANGTSSTSNQNWLAVMRYNLWSTYKVTKAVWPFLLKQKCGRIINTGSSVGIYGSTGKAHYAAVKCGILGFSRALAIEGAKYNIFVNTIAPSIDLLDRNQPHDPAFNPEHIAPLVLALCSDTCPDQTGGLYEVGGGWCGRVRWQQTGGVCFSTDTTLTPEIVAKDWQAIVSFSRLPEYPGQVSDTMSKIMNNLQYSDNAKASENSNDYLQNIKTNIGKFGPPLEFNYESRDSILYNIGVGANSTELRYVYEGADDFQVLPTFGVIPGFTTDTPFDFNEIIPNFDPMMFLHGEQYLEVRKYPVPTSARLISKCNLIEVVDKGSAALARLGTTTTHAETNEIIFYNESTVFLRGSGGFNGPRISADRGAVTATNSIPSRPPDAFVESYTHADQATIYRLSGDYHPLHVDPAMAQMAGFEKPILHGLCTFGIAGKAIYETYGAFQNIKVRFVGTVDPGDTIITEMWKEKQRVLFQCKVKESGKLVIGAAAAELVC